MKKQDFAERHGYVKGVVKAIVHDSGRGAPVAQIQFKDSYRFKKINTLLCAPEGLYSGQFIFAGRKGNLFTLHVFDGFMLLIVCALIYSQSCYWKHSSCRTDP